jgi:hypothetical protein
MSLFMSSSLDDVDAARLLSDSHSLVQLSDSHSLAQQLASPKLKQPRGPQFPSSL